MVHETSSFASFWSLVVLHIFKTSVILFTKKSARSLYFLSSKGRCVGSNRSWHFLRSGGKLPHGLCQNPLCRVVSGLDRRRGSKRCVRRGRFSIFDFCPSTFRTICSLYPHWEHLNEYWPFERTGRRPHRRAPIRFRSSIWLHFYRARCRFTRRRIILSCQSNVRISRYAGSNLDSTHF